MPLRQAGYEVTVLSPRGKGYTQNHEVLEGVHIYRHPMPKEGNTPFGYLWEYGCALFWEFFYTWWIFLCAADFTSSRDAILRTTFS